MRSAVVHLCFLALLYDAWAGDSEEQWKEQVEPFTELTDGSPDPKYRLAAMDPGSELIQAQEFKQWIQADFHRMNEGLSAQLDAVNPIVDLLTDKFQLLFTVYNPTPVTKHLLKWDSPMFTNEKGRIGGNVFEVRTAAGKLLKYTGRDMKMGVDPDTGAPPKDAFVEIAPGQSLTNRVSPAMSYAYEGDGYYYIRVRQGNQAADTFTDVMRTFTKVYLKNVKAHMKKVRAIQEARARGNRKVLVDTGAKVGGLSFEGCSTSKQQELLKWHADAKDKIRAAIACTVDNSCASQVDTWFGASIRQTKFADKVTHQYGVMLQRMDAAIYACDNSAIQRNCGGSTFAFVYPTDSSQKIHMCDFTFTYPDYSEKVQTVIHELSHYDHIGNTNDNAYGESTCQQLAQQNPDAAIQTADNVGYFGKYQPGPFCNAPAGYDPNCRDQYSNCASLARNCAARTSAGLVRAVCCKSCNAGAPADRSGCGGGGPPSPPAPAPITRAPTPPPTSSRGTCRYENDGECDVPSFCPAGTDTADCGQGPSPPAPVPVPVPVPVPPTPAPTPPPVARRRSSSSGGTCRYENDGECDVPSFCPAGTDVADCGGQPVTTRSPTRSPTARPAASCTTDKSSSCPSWVQQNDCNTRYNAPINGYLKDYCCASCSSCSDSSSRCPTYAQNYNCASTTVNGNTPLGQFCCASCRSSRL